jgi:hypothetical protein
LLDQPQPMDGSDQWMMGRFVLNHAVYYRNHRRARVSEITICGLAGWPARRSKIACCIHPSRG